ncbi:hypothetical protein sS8_2086 [Methylocaldum marinum]|uniref:Uncharacterized protein n=1 Tax=Methylocaldum marinum TaxID=1432792 RepID=A0A250KQZ4_9GAMM|nr:hypothetical protein [Methylocaldum marinum]BBA34038.1 hypothetical protein sS8_2086 [Methylocaldum marinum]
MFNTFFSIRKNRNASALATASTIHPACPLQQPQPPSGQTPVVSARVNYDIPTYIRRGIKLSGLN